MKKRIIGVFDSGVGGLSVLEEIKKVNPNEEYVYLKDTENFPYGEKKKEEIIKLTRNNIKKLIEKNAKLIVIACGTATSQALETVKNEFEIPDNIIPVCLLPLGYKDINCPKSPNHSMRKSIDNIIEYK